MCAQTSLRTHRADNVRSLRARHLAALLFELRAPPRDPVVGVGTLCTTDFDKRVTQDRIGITERGLQEG